MGLSSYQRSSSEREEFLKEKFCCHNNVFIAQCAFNARMLILTFACNFLLLHLNMVKIRITGKLDYLYFVEVAFFRAQIGSVSAGGADVLFRNRGDFSADVRAV